MSKPKLTRTRRGWRAELRDGDSIFVAPGKTAREAQESVERYAKQAKGGRDGDD